MTQAAPSPGAYALATASPSSLSPAPLVHANALVLAPMTPAERRVALEPRTLAEGYQLAKIIGAAKMFGISGAEQAFVVIATGMSLGITAITALRAIQVIDGKPAPSADLLEAVCLQSELCEYFRCLESTPKKAVYVTKRRDRPEQRVEWTWERAENVKRSGKSLTSGANWQNFPDQMLRARAKAELARFVYPDITLGLFTPDELGDVNVAPQAIVANDHLALASAPAPVLSSPHDPQTGEVFDEPRAKRLSPDDAALAAVHAEFRDVRVDLPTDDARARLDAAVKKRAGDVVALRTLLAGTRARLASAETRREIEAKLDNAASNIEIEEFEREIFDAEGRLHGDDALALRNAAVRARQRVEQESSQFEKHHGEGRFEQ